MTDREWAKFFELVTEIVNGEGTVNEKIQELRTRAEDAGDEAEMNLEELLSWNVYPD